MIMQKPTVADTGRFGFVFGDGSRLEYDRGNFDDWCVWLTSPDGSRRAPRDVEYFERLAEYARRCGAAQLYADLAAVYARTTRNPEPSTADFIGTLCAKYGADAGALALLYSIIYMGMVAEENKENAPLGKRIKRLGLHQLLVEGLAPQEAADFSRGRTWRELAALCSERGV